MARHKVAYSQFFSRQDVCDLSTALIAVADQYPLSYRTERDFFPLIYAYLHGRVPHLRAEATQKAGRADFRVGGNNPVYLELAVAPRALIDPYDTTVRFPGNSYKSQLYAAANKPETTGKPATAGTLCRPKVTVVLKGTLTSSGATLGMKVEHGNRWARAYTTLGTANLVIDGTTKVRRKGQKLATALVVGDRLLVQARACKADLTAQGTPPALTAVRVVAHPAKMQRNREGKFPTPGLYDISDSAHWANKPDIGIVVHREDLTNSETTIRVVKSRYHQAIGRPGDKSLLPESLQAREQPSGRLPLRQLIREGRFDAPSPA